MARRRGRSIKTRIRDVDRGYKKLLKRLGVQARKARRGAKTTAKRGAKSIKSLLKDAAKEIKRARKKKPTAQQMHALVVTIGIHEEEGAATHEAEGGGSSDATLAEVASFNELGLGVPERPFIRGWADEAESKNKDRLRKIGQAVVTGHVSSPRQGLNRFGVVSVADVQKRISDGGAFQDNADSTIAAKGSSTPLINTSQMRSAITYKVDKRSTGGGSGEGE